MTQDRDPINGTQEPTFPDSSPPHDTAAACKSNTTGQSGRLLPLLSVVAALASAAAAGLSALAAHQLVSISELQHKQEVERISFFSYVADKTDWSVKMVQLAGRTVDIYTVRIVPIFLDGNGNTHATDEVSVSVVPFQDFAKN